jgi:gamma-glutamylaminecyclotransferase
MCIIIVKQKEEQKVSKEVLKTSSKINPHGLGVVWLDTFEVSYHKSKEYNILDTTRPYIAHFRYATIGKVNKSNTHPFVCGNNLNELLMMNGSIYGMGNQKVCDTKVLANKLGTMNRCLWKNELSQYEHRFVSINTKYRTFQIYNKDLWIKKEGVWYSKDNVLRDNLIAVYGTLKKNYSNYNHYLRSSKYVGNGKTKDKYPLIIEGLPYMVNKKGVGHNVVVDVFKVSNSVFKNIDNLEGHPNWYKRIQVPIVVKGKTLNCWLYFNDKNISKNTKLYTTYTQQYSGWGFGNRTPSNWYSAYSKRKSVVGKVKSYSPKKYDWSQSTFDFDNDMQVDTFREDEVVREEDIVSKNPYCVDCYSELQFDEWENYHCNSCGGWFTKSEVLVDSI